MIVTEPREDIFRWIRERTYLPLSEDFIGLAQARDDCLCAAVAYTARAGRTAFLSGAIDSPATVSRTFIRAMFEYPFVTLGMTCLFAYVTGSNKRSLSFCLKSGFQVLKRIPGAGADGDDLFLLELEPRNCKFLRRHHEFRDGYALRSRRPAGP
jgi:hypothetical protein